MVYDVPSQHVRGEHAHRVCEQYLIASHGKLTVLLDDGKNQIEVCLDNRMQGLYLCLWFGAFNISLVLTACLQ